MVGTAFSLCLFNFSVFLFISSSRLFSPEKPSILGGSGSVVVSSGKQAPLSMQQLHQRAANIPPMVSAPSSLLHFPSSSAALARSRDWERLGHRASPRPPRHVSPDNETRDQNANSNQFGFEFCDLEQLEPRMILRMILFLSPHCFKFTLALVGSIDVIRRLLPSLLFLLYLNQGCFEITSFGISQVVGFLGSG